MPQPIIPPGWYRIELYETILNGDKFHEEGIWHYCNSSIGDTPEESGFGDTTDVIRAIHVPTGWRVMVVGEVATKADKVFICENRWDQVNGYDGEKVWENGPTFIRLDTGPAPEKEWLNPWD